CRGCEESGDQDSRVSAQEKAGESVVRHRDHRGMRTTKCRSKRKNSLVEHKERRQKTMQLVEKHVIDRDDPRYEAIDRAAFASKNLLNATLYVVRQSFIFEKKYLNYNAMDKIMQGHEAYRALPSKVAQEVVKQVHEAWESYFAACEEYKKDPSKFLGHPR